MPPLAVFRQRFRALAERPYLRRLALGLITGLVLVALFGQLLLPAIIKSELETVTADKLHRRLAIEKVEINPFVLSVQFHGVKLMEPDGVTSFASFDDLKLDLSVESLFRLAPVVQEMRLSQPRLQLVRTAANHYNIDDILQLIADQPASDQPTRFSVHNIQVERGQIEFADQPEEITHTVSELTVGIPFISSLPSEVAVFVEPSLSARVNGALLQLKGKARPYSAHKEASLELNLDDLDLTRYVDYLPYPPRFKLPAAKLDVHLTASFDQRAGKAPALVLSGLTRLRSALITDRAGRTLLKLPELAVTIGSAEVFANRYEFAKVVLTRPEIQVRRDKSGTINLALLAPPPATASDKQAAGPAVGSGPAFNLSVGELRVQDGTVHFDDQQAAGPRSTEIGKLDLVLAKIALDMQKRQASIGEANSASGELVVRLQPADSAAPSAAAAQIVAAADDRKHDFVLAIGKLTLDRWSARIEDRSLPQPVITSLTPIFLSAQYLSNAADQRGALEFKTTVNHGGQLAIVGALGVAPAHADLRLDLKGVDILSLQPLLTDYLNLLVTRASLTAHGRLLLDRQPDGRLQGGFTGDLTLGNLAAVDKVNANEFLRWKSLYLGGMDLQLAPFSLVLEQVALSDFFARLIVDADGRFNLQNIQRSHPDEQLSLTDADAPKSNRPAAAPTAAGKPPPIRIRKTSLQGGRVRFTDNFIKPHYSATLEDLGGAIGDLSSDDASTASVDLHGRVNDAPLRIAGSINPLRRDLFLDLKANVQGMELAPLSAYSGKYVGYDIEKGKLSFEANYQLDQRKLSAQNRLVLDQLTFGEKIDSPTATSLPVQLAVALLRDRNGVIDINLPVSGSLDDPEFSLGGIIVKVMVNLIAKAVTAPFALLGSLFGGGEELSWLEFDPGRSVVPASGEAKLQSLTRALRERPALKLEIAGRIDPDSDRKGLRRAALERKVRALKLSELRANDPSAETAGAAVKAEEYPALLTRVYRNEKMPKPRNAIGLQKDLPVDEMERLLAANVEVSDDDLALLANRRAQAVKGSLLKSGEVGAERLFIVTGRPARSAGEGSQAPPRRADLFLR